VAVGVVAVLSVGDPSLRKGEEETVPRDKWFRIWEEVPGGLSKFGHEVFRADLYTLVLGRKEKEKDGFCGHLKSRESYFLKGSGDRGSKRGQQQKNCMKTFGGGILYREKGISPIHPFLQWEGSSSDGSWRELGCRREKTGKGVKQHLFRRRREGGGNEGGKASGDTGGGSRLGASCKKARQFEAKREDKAKASTRFS